MHAGQMELPPRIRRTLELVYGVEGVTAFYLNAGEGHMVFI